MSVVHLHLDFETRSLLDIREVGLDRYARSAEVLMMAWAINDQPPQLWLPKRITRCIECGSLKDERQREYDLDCRCGGEWLSEQNFPPQVEILLTSSAAVKIAWNAAFERAILTHCLGIASPIEQWLDPSVIARYAGMPGKLAKVSQFMKLGDKGKDKDGTRLINKFSKPYKKRGSTELLFRDFNDEKHTADWEKFKSYCKQDVFAEREIFHRLKGFFMPPASEMRLWELDAKINERGMPVNMVFVKNAKAIADSEMERLGAELRELTGLENPNSRQQFLPWLQTRGYPFASLDKAHVVKAIGLKFSDRDIAGVEAVRALQLRQQLSLTSVKKLDSILARVGPGDRIRHGYIFAGAHTLRWSGSGVQPHNFPRGTIEPEKVDAAVEVLSA